MDSLKAALAYAQRGWQVVPLHNPKEGKCSCRKKDCDSPGKHPRTEHGLKDGSKDASQIQKWFARWPDANLGIVTGQASGLLVLDVDGEDGKTSLQALTAAYEPLPRTLCVKTGRASGDGKRKGCHYYFHAPSGVTIRNSAGVLGKGLDVRCEGGYVVAPPSLHPSGLLYEWLSQERSLAELPTWILDKLVQAKPAAKSAEPQGGDFPEGRRNATLASLAGTMRRAGMVLEAIEAALLKENAARCRPPLPESEVREIARSIARYTPGAPETSPPVQNMVCQPPPGPWPTPLAEVAFCGLPGDFVRLVGPETEADPAAMIFQFLAAIGSIIGRGPHVRIGPDKHYTNLFIGIVGNSAKARKGMSWGEVCRICELTDIHWFKTRIISGLTSGEGLIHAVRDEVKEMVPIKDRQRVVDRQEQVIVEAQTDKRLMCVENEFAQALKNMERQGSTLSVVMRLAWDSRQLRVATKHTKESCEEPHIGIVGHITGMELQKLLSASDLANGFANRFLFVCAARSKLLPFGGQVEREALSILGERLRDAVRFARTRGEMAWTIEAADLWEHQIYPKLTEGKLGLLGEVTARAEAQVLRLTMLYALLGKSAELRLEDLRAAVELWRYSEESAAFIFGQALGDPTADAIVEFLRARPEGVTRTELNSDLFKGNKSKAEIDASIDLARANGLIRIERRIDTGGRPVEVLFLVSV